MKELPSADRGFNRAPRIGYWMFNFDPKWEAASRELNTLATSFRSVYGTRTISLNLNGRATALRGTDKHLPLSIALPALPLLLRAARTVPVNHIFASPGERLLLPRLARLNGTILTVTKGSPTLRALERNIDTLASLRHIVVESERHHATSIAGIVQRQNCGVVFDPTVQSLCEAIRRLSGNYDAYQPNAERTLKREFSKDGFLDRYGKLYASLLAEQR